MNKNKIDGDDDNEPELSDYELDEDPDQEQHVNLG